MRHPLDYYVQREANRQKWMLRLSGLFLSIALGLLVVLIVQLAGCAAVESDEDAVLEDLEYSVGQEPIPFAEGRRPHYTALDGTVWYDNAGNIIRDNDMENPWTTKTIIFEPKGKNGATEKPRTINLYYTLCKHCDEVNFLPAQKTKQPCTSCGRMIKNDPRAS